MTYTPFVYPHMGSRKRVQRSRGSPKAMRTAASPRSMGVVIPHDHSYRPSNADPAMSSFHIRIGYRGSEEMAQPGHVSQAPSCSSQQSNVSPPYADDAYMSEQADTQCNRLLNESPNFITTRPFSGSPHSSYASQLALHNSMNQDDLHEFLRYDQFCAIAEDYVMGLSERKRDKSLLPAWRCANIRKVLKDPKATTVETAQFRFWAKKMFRCKVIVPYSDGEPYDLVTHEQKPVACREDIYQILVDCHRLCSHGGRDKTAAQVRKLWSWIPKELIARFVANCPTCMDRRNNKSNASSQRRGSPSSTSSPIELEPMSNQNALINTRSPTDSIGFHNALTASIPASVPAATAAPTIQSMPQFVPNGYSFAPAQFAPSDYPMEGQEQYLGNGHYTPNNPFGGYH